MSEGIKIPLSDALFIAKEVFDVLKPYCDRIHIAGSIRREKDFVGDIEIVCQPRVEILKDELWDEGIIRNLEFCNIVDGWQKVKGDSEGKYTQRILPISNMKLDLFMPDDFDYYRQLAIRTGSSDYSFKVIANGWKNKGWCGSDKGLRLQSDCVKKGNPPNDRWVCINPEAEKPPHWMSEEEFFEWIRVKWIHPKERI